MFLFLNAYNSQSNSQKRCTMLRSFISLILLSTCSLALASEVNIYSARQEQLIKPLLDQFTQETGIKVNLVTGDADALLSRLQSEGDLSPADLLITTDAGRLHRAKERSEERRVGKECRARWSP